MWGGNDTVGHAQMFLVRLFLINPLKAITPSCVLFLIYRLIFFQRRTKRSLAKLSFARYILLEVLTGYATLEVLFFMYYKFRLSILSGRSYRPLKPLGWAMKSFKKILKTVIDLEDHARELTDLDTHLSRVWVRDTGMRASLSEPTFTRNMEELIRHAESGMWDFDVKQLKIAELRGWFLGAEVRSIYADNAREWICWAMYNCELREVPESRKDELEKLFRMAQQFFEIDFRKGYNPKIRSMRLSLDPILSEHRPLLYYLFTTSIFDVITWCLMKRLGFSVHKSGTIAYWYRPGSNPDSVPFVFCHGIGIGVLPYMQLIELLAFDTDRSIFCPILPSISMRISEDVPSPRQTVIALEEMLLSWNLSSAHWVGHSFGSVVLAWVVRQKRSMVRFCSFIDPVCFLLVKPDIAHNFVYRKPETPTQLLIHWFVARELHIAHTLSRNFFWDENIVWAEDLTFPTLVILSGQDSIVPSFSVRRYLNVAKRKGHLFPLEVHWFEELGHGEINFGSKEPTIIVSGKIFELEKQVYMRKSFSTDDL